MSDESQASKSQNEVRKSIFSTSSILITILSHFCVVNSCYLSYVEKQANLSRYWTFFEASSQLNCVPVVSVVSKHHLIGIFDVFFRRKFRKKSP
jgi:hypothetical protein